MSHQEQYERQGHPLLYQVTHSYWYHSSLQCFQQPKKESKAQSLDILDKIMWVSISETYQRSIELTLDTNKKTVNVKDRREPYSILTHIKAVPCSRIPTDLRSFLLFQPFLLETHFLDNSFMIRPWQFNSKSVKTIGVTNLTSNNTNRTLFSYSNLLLFSGLAALTRNTRPWKLELSSSSSALPKITVQY